MCCCCMFSHRRWMFSSGIHWHKLVELGSQITAPKDRYISINRKTANTFYRQHRCRCHICVLVNPLAPAIDPDPHFCTHSVQWNPNIPKTQRISANRTHQCTIVSTMVHGSFYRISYIHLSEKQKRNALILFIKKPQQQNEMLVSTRWNLMKWDTVARFIIVVTFAIFRWRTTTHY